MTSQPQGMKTLHPMFKQAKTFEVRRLVKKIKFLRYVNIDRVCCLRDADHL